jgi:hypothetical protein
MVQEVNMKVVELESGVNGYGWSKRVMGQKKRKVKGWLRVALMIGDNIVVLVPSWQGGAWEK